jgi:hypothetical protein
MVVQHSTVIILAFSSPPIASEDLRFREVGQSYGGNWVILTAESTLTNEAVANRHFADIAALEDQVATRCRSLSEQPDVIRSHTRFHWWPTEEAA